MNKELNGGFGTVDDIGDSLFSKAIKVIRRRSTKLPIMSLAFLQAILKQKGHVVKYYEGSLPQDTSDLFDVILIYGSIVDFTNENEVAGLFKKRFPYARIGVIGTFPSRNPQLFDNADFVVLGEPEAYFANEFKDIGQLKGDVQVSSFADLDSLPNPCFDGFPVKEYTYKIINKKTPFLILQASKGCPYSCRYYCAYGEYQGARSRLRSPIKVVDDIVYIQNKYGAKGVQFRDPVFGVDTNFVLNFCDELERRNVKVAWGIETRLDLLGRDIIKRMYEVGLRNINVGIETNNSSVAIRNKRKLIEQNHQEEIISYCEKLGVKVIAFYLIALEDDTEATIKDTIRYAIKLNTPLARFAVATPYPGTGFYKQLESQDRILTKNFEEYTQFNLVYKHNNLSPRQVKKLLDKAYRNYYLRPSYLIKMLKWKIREYWL